MVNLENCSLGDVFLLFVKGGELGPVMDLELLICLNDSV